VRTTVIGDIHGCYQELIQLLDSGMMSVNSSIKSLLSMLISLSLINTFDQCEWVKYYIHGQKLMIPITIALSHSAYSVDFSGCHFLLR
jgi:hypothetical protein